MSVFIAGVFIIGGLLAATIVAVGVPMLVGLVAYDLVSARKSEGTQEISSEVAASRTAEAAEGRIMLERGIARTFVVFGGVFWGVTTFAGLYSFQQTGVGWAMLAAFVPFVATLATLVVGWYYERITTIMLAIASAGVVYWGVVHQFELGVWVIVTVAMIGPMLTAAVLFWMARREQEALELSLAATPELVTVPAQRRPVA